MLEIELKQLFNAEIKKYRKGYLSAIYTFKIKNGEIYRTYHRLIAKILWE